MTPGRASARRVAGGMLIVGLIITAVATWWGLERDSRLADEQLASTGKLLVFGTEELLEDAERQIAAAGSLFRSSEHVAPDEFAVFAGDIGLMPGILGLGYVPIIPHDQLDSWLAETQSELPGLALFEIGPDDQVVPVQPRPLHFPLLYFGPSELQTGLIGLDLGFHEGWYDDLVDGTATTGTVMTSFTDSSLPAPLNGEDQFIVGWPIEDLATGQVDASVVAIVDLGVLVASNLSAEVTSGIEWQIVDATEGQTQTGDPESWSGTFDFGNRTWLVTATDIDVDEGWLPGTVAYPFLGGLAITVLLAMIGQLAVTRSTGKRKVETLESLNEAKDEFLAAVSHRLRTPLTAVVGFSEILKDNETGLSEADRGELLSTIAVQAIELGHLFDNLLTVTRDTDRTFFSPKRVSVVSELHAVLDSVEPSRRAKVRMAAADPEVAVAGDPGLVRQVLRNLIANATDFGQKVELNVLDGGHVARIVVKDDGPGVPAARAASVFDLYDKASHHRGQPESMGVGLFVSRRLARRMSGDITYRRSAGWTVFELSLPAIPNPVKARELSQDVTVG
ncbi:MAG: hypothetical protein GY788_27465 [bacterium]|nr:hypothetical protein [bacterium]